MNRQPTSHSPRIGILCEYASLNGGEMSLLSVLDSLSRQECQPLLLCPADGPLACEIQRRGISLTPIPQRDGNQSLESWKTRWRQWLQETIREQQLDLLHANSLTMSRRLGSEVSQLACPTTGHLRDILKLKPAHIRALNQHHRLIAVSYATAEFHRRQGITPQKLTVIHNGIDSARFFPAEPTGFLHRELHLPAHVRLAVTIGQICLRKGQVDLALAAAQLKDRFPDLHFVVIGKRHSTKQESRDYEARFMKIFSSAGMSDRLHCLGIRSDIPQILNEATLLIHPARQEPLGRVLLEAAGCGVPIVATDVGGTREILTHGISGWLVPADDPHALADGISQVLKNPDQARVWGTAAHREIVTRFTSQNSARKLLSVWKDILSSASRV